MRTCRRQLLDEFLNEVKPHLVGVVLDIGGKKSDKRGLFRPPLNQVDSWLYLNIDSTTSPNIVASADQIPLPDECIDTFVLCEVLEHLAEPEKCLSEASRILKPGGEGIITIPFLYPIHADPWDFQRWTDVRIKRELTRVGLELVELRIMGGMFAVLIDILHIQLNELPKYAKLRRRAGILVLKIAKYVFRSMVSNPNPRITTGYGLIARKPKMQCNLIKQ